MTFDDVLALKVGSNNVSAVYIGSTLVWPNEYTYHIVSNTVSVHYSSGNQLNAAGTNYAYFTGDVRLQRGQVVIQTISDAVLTPSFSSSAYFYVSGNEIHAYNRGQNEGGQLSISVNVSYGDDSVSSAGTVYQQANVKTDLTPTTERYYDTPTVTTEEIANSRFVTIGATSYKSSSNPAPASGGSTTLYWSAGHTERQKTVTPWTDVTTPHYTYTALNGQVLDGTPYVSDSGSTTTYGNPYGVEDTPTISGSATGFTRSGNTVSIANRGTTTGQARSVTYTATNGSATPATVTIYQEANVVTSYTYNLAIAIDVTGTIPAEGGRYDVIYTSQRTPTYTSGASGSAENCTASITGTNCTPNINTVTGVESLNIGVDENTSTSVTPTVSVTISAGGYFATDTKTQDAAPIVPQATIYPEVESDGSVVMRFFMTQGSYPGGLVVVEGAVYHYVMDGISTEQTVSLSMKTFTGDGGSEALPVSVHYFSGDAGEHWFTATRVSRIGLNNTTFPHKDFEVR